MKLYQSDNKIIVTELNPMCEAPSPGDFIAFTQDGRPHSVYLTVLRKCVINSALSRTYDLDYFIGWLPMPVYDPLQKQPDNFSRGVRTMFDYLQTRIANNFSGNPETQAHLNEINNTLKDWLSDALEEVSPDDYNEWVEYTGSDDQIEEIKSGFIFRDVNGGSMVEVLLLSILGGTVCAATAVAILIILWK